MPGSAGKLNVGDILDVRSKQQSHQDRENDWWYSPIIVTGFYEGGITYRELRKDGAHLLLLKTPEKSLPISEYEFRLDPILTHSEHRDYFAKLLKLPVQETTSQHPSL